MEFKDAEDKIKEALEARKIQPQTDLWNRLEDELDKEQASKTQWELWKIAAVVVVLLGVSGLVFIPNWTAGEISHTEDPMEVQENIATEEIQKTSIVKEVEPAQKESPILEQETEIAVGEEPQIEPQKGEIKAVAIQQTPKQTKNPKKVEKEPIRERAIVKVDEDIEQEIVPSSLPVEKKESNSTEMLATQLLAEVEASMNPTPEMEAEQLIAQVLERKTREQGREIPLIDPDQLLAEVVRDMGREEDRDFRRTVGELIKEGWEKTKSFVVTGISND